jgi:hypothetical protein
MEISIPSMREGLTNMDLIGVASLLLTIDSQLPVDG